MRDGFRFGCGFVAAVMLGFSVLCVGLPMAADFVDQYQRTSAALRDGR